MTNLNLDAMTQKLADNSNAAEQKATDASQLDFSKPGNLILFQKAMGEYTQALELQSTIQKRLGDTISGIIQKI